MRFSEFNDLPIITDVVVVGDDGAAERFDEGKWISGKLDGNIRIDQPTHGVGQPHAHVYGRKGKELVVVNFDGTASHKKSGRLPDEDADALRARGWKISASNIVEWTVLGTPYQFLVE